MEFVIEFVFGFKPFVFENEAGVNDVFFVEENFDKVD